LLPDADNAVLGLTELIVNGIEHGNLEIGYDLKTELLEKGLWMEEVERRSTLHENIAKVVGIVAKRRGGCVESTISDCGDGFDHEKFMTIDPARAYHHHGRGIAM
jgi:two-component system cell cycle response regulator